MAYSAGVPVTLPTCCPRHGDGGECDVRRKGVRVRKCGPADSLTVARCWDHAIVFTLYPIGWTPYGRAPVVPAGSGGTTVFSAVLEVAALPSLSAASGYRRTRVRSIRLAALWLALSAESHESVAAALDMDLSAHATRRAAYARSTWHSRAQIVAEAHAAVAVDRRLDRLLVAGFHARCLGRPWGVDPATGALVLLVSSAEVASRRKPVRGFPDFAGVSDR